MSTPIDFTEDMLYIEDDWYRGKQEDGFFERMLNEN